MGEFRRRSFMQIGFSIALVGNLLVVSGLILQYINLVRDISNNDYKVVDGIVTNFHPMPRSGHAVENFDVDGVHFFYSDYILNPGFNTTSSRGGSIREGLHVRISYIGNTIIKLEVAQ
jgi:hypothetical protein